MKMQELKESNQFQDSKRNKKESTTVSGLKFLFNALVKPVSKFVGKTGLSFIGTAFEILKNLFEGGSKAIKAGVSKISESNRREKEFKGEIKPNRMIKPAHQSHERQYQLAEKKIEAINSLAEISNKVKRVSAIRDELISKIKRNRNQRRKIK